MDPIIKNLYTQEELEGKIVEYNEKYEKYKGKNDYELMVQKYGSIGHSQSYPPV
jgi:hypothetical protein